MELPGINVKTKDLEAPASCRVYKVWGKPRPDVLHCVMHAINIEDAELQSNLRERRRDSPDAPLSHPRGEV